MSRLGEIIQRKINEAILNPGKETTTLELPSGLRFKMRKDNQRFTLYLSRIGNTPPSAIELETFINHWPNENDIETENFISGIVFHIIEK